MKRYRWLIAICLGLAGLPGASAAIPGDDQLQIIDPLPPPAVGDDGTFGAVVTDWFTTHASGVFWSDALVLEGTVGQSAAGSPSMSEVVDLYGGFWAPDDDDTGSVVVDDLELGCQTETGTANGAGLTHGPNGVSVETIREFSLLPIAPNPSPGAAWIAWTVPHEARLRLTVHDVQGRQVASLADGVYPAGRYGTKWGPRGKVGGSPPGMYFVRLQGPDGVRVKRVVFLNR